MSLIIGVDLGGTRLRAARLDPDLEVLEREEMLTLADEGFAATFERIKTIIQHRIRDGESVTGIGVSIPGPTNPFSGIVELGTNLKGWENVPLMQLLGEHFRAPVYIGNDANVAALAETVKGAAQDYRHVIFITVSTGIGGGIIVDGRLLLGKSGLGAEVGHMVIATEEGHISTLEKESAGPSMARRARRLIEGGAVSMLTDLANGDLTKISGKHIGQAAKAGDKLALEIVQRSGRILGYGVTSLLHIFNPEIIVFGGGVSQLGDLLFNPMREAMEATVIDSAYVKDLKIVGAALGDNVSLVGAGALVITRGGVEKISAIRAQLDA